MGAVWLARDDLLGREVALKQVLPQPGADVTQAAEQRERSLREGRIAARLTHPHVIAMYDVALDGGEPWLVMEYLPSRSLAAVLNATGPLPVAEVIRIGAQLSDALAAAHSVGIVHRDVKPGNVLIAEGGGAPGTVKITDFGISHAYGDVTLTQTGILHGTPAYLAPEVARGGDPSAASDVFSLGATLFTAVEGAPPFGFGENNIALLHRVARGEIPTPERAGAMTATLLHMLEPNPDHRPTMSQARDALATAGKGNHGYPATVPTLVQFDSPDTNQRTRTGLPFAAPPTVRRRPSRAGWIAAGLVVLLLLAAAASVVAVTRNGGSSAAPLAVPPATSSATPAATTPPSPAATTAPTTTAPTTTAPTTTAPRTTTTPSATTRAAPTLTADSATSAVRAYYALLPADTSTAFTGLGPNLKAQGFDAYNNFWSSFQRVTAQDASSDDGGSTVQVTVTFDRGKGPTTEEVHRLTMLASDSGPLIDTDTLVSSRKGK